MSSLGPKRYDAFLSYNSQDRPAVREVAERLEGEGLELYLEEWELAPGREFQPALAEGLRDSKTCVVFLGPNGLGPWQKQELQVAIDKRARDAAFHVIPVLLPGTERPRRGDVAHLEFLINASWVEFLTTLDDERAFRSLVWGITGTKPPESDKRYEGVCLSPTSYLFRLDDSAQLRSLVGWAPKIIDTFMSGQAHVANERFGESRQGSPGQSAFAPAALARSPAHELW